MVVEGIVRGSKSKPGSGNKTGGDLVGAGMSEDTDTYLARIARAAERIADALDAQREAEQRRAKTEALNIAAASTRFKA